MLAKDPWRHVLSLPGALDGLLETPPRWHVTIFLHQQLFLPIETSSTH